MQRQLEALEHGLRGEEDLPTDLMAYTELKHLEKVVKKALERIQARILSQMDDDTPDLIFDGCKYSRRIRQSYTYSAEVDELTEQLKALKNMEEGAGIAVAKEPTVYLQVAVPKK